LQVLVVWTAGRGGVAIWIAKSQPNGRVADADTALSSQSKRPRGLFYPSQAQWATLTSSPCSSACFRSEHVTEGKIAVDEDRATPIFSPTPVA